MRALVAILAGLACGAGGYILTAVVAFVLFGPGSGGGDSGGFAMGVMFAIAPIGAVIGAFAGLFLVLARRNRKSVTPAPDLPDAEAEPRGTQDGVTGGHAASAATGAPRRFGVQGAIAVGVMAAIVAGIYFALFYEYVPPQFGAYQRKPELIFEVSVPSKAVVEDRFFTARGELRSWEHLLAPRGGLSRRADAERTVFSGTVQLWNKVDDRKIWFRPAQSVFVEFDLPIAAVPEHETEFGAWRPADTVEIGQGDDETYRLKPEEAMIRTRVVWP